MLTEQKKCFHCSDDEGEPDEEDDDENDDDDASDECNEDYDGDFEIVKENGLTTKDDSPTKPQSSVCFCTFYLYLCSFVYFVNFYPLTCVMFCLNLNHEHYFDLQSLIQYFFHYSINSKCLSIQYIHFLTQLFCTNQMKTRFLPRF